jgi:hypothetical protein
MSDLKLTRDRTGETMVVHVEGLTDDGIDFINGYVDDELYVVDADRIIIPEARVPRLLRWCEAEGLEVFTR